MKLPAVVVSGILMAGAGTGALLTSNILPLDTASIFTREQPQPKVYYTPSDGFYHTLQCARVPDAPLLAHTNELTELGYVLCTECAAQKPSGIQHRQSDLVVVQHRDSLGNETTLYNYSSTETSMDAATAAAAIDAMNTPRNTEIHVMPVEQRPVIQTQRPAPPPVYHQQPAPQQAQPVYGVDRRRMREQERRENLHRGRGQQDRPLIIDPYTGRGNNFYPGRPAVVDPYTGQGINY